MVALNISTSTGRSAFMVSTRSTGLWSLVSALGGLYLLPPRPAHSNPEDLGLRRSFTVQPTSCATYFQVCRMASALRPPGESGPFASTRQRRPGSDDASSAAPSQSLPQRPFDNIDASSADPRVDAPRTLTQSDVAALIINKMIGTGVFTGPYTVLMSTRSKSVSMGLWAVGFVYTILR